MTKKHIGTCCICGREGKLTFEHIPPHKASNGFPLKLYNVGKYITENNARYSSLQNGAGAWTLCSSCNNLTGAWYGNAYVEFASQGITYYRKKAAGIIAVPYTIYPLRVFKQIVSCFASVNGANWCKENPAFRDFLLNPKSRSFPDDVDIRMYLQSSGRCKLNGIEFVADVSTGDQFCGSEFAYPPFAFVCDCSHGRYYSKSFQKLFSIREFLKYNYDDRVTLYLNIPRKPCNPFLLDFREGVPSIEEHSRQLRERAMATNT